MTRLVGTAAPATGGVEVFAAFQPTNPARYNMGTVQINYVSTGGDASVYSARVQASLDGGNNYYTVATFTSVAVGTASGVQDVALAPHMRVGVTATTGSPGPDSVPIYLDEKDD